MRLRHERWPHQDPRLRTGQAGSPKQSVMSLAPTITMRRGHGHGWLYVSRASARTGRPSHRHLLSRNLRDGDGKRTFERPTSADTMSAILNEPTPISDLAPETPVALQRSCCAAWRRTRERFDRRRIWHLPQKRCRVWDRSREHPPESGPQPASGDAGRAEEGRRKSGGSYCCGSASNPGGGLLICGCSPRPLRSQPRSAPRRGRSHWLELTVPNCSRGGSEVPSFAFHGIAGCRFWWRPRKMSIMPSDMVP
jgi:hypothetical protein